jgi:Beta-ketoacyl synthase, N-terminal domain
LSTSTLTAAIEGIGVLGPGLPDWPTSAAVLAGIHPYSSARTVLPTPEVLPPAERRRAGRVIKLALAVGAEALAQSRRDARGLPSVFSSSGGDGDNCHAICEALTGSERLISPTRFHNSVHNAAAGYWSIAYGCAEASVTLCAYDASFGAGLLEAMLQVACAAGPVLLVAYDADYPPPLRDQRRIPDAFGLSLLLAPGDSTRALATISVSLCQQPASVLEQAALESLRVAIPAARGLPLLLQLARARPGSVTLDYLDTARMAVAVEL